MNKRKQLDSCSDCSIVSNPQSSCLDFTAESSCGSSVKKPKFDDGGGSIEFRLITNVGLNGAPFFDFFPLKDSQFSETNTCRISFNFTVSPLPSRHSVANPVLTESLRSVDASIVCSTVSETEAETETGLAVVPLNVHIPDDAVLLNWSVLGNLKVVTGEWTAKKVLTKSDCDNQHRLLIGREEAQKNILNFLDEARMEKVYSKDGLRLNVFDCDTGSWVEQTLKRWASSKGIGLMDNWKRDFVVRRGLKVGDEVGLCWGDQHENLLFSVLRRS